MTWGELLKQGQERLKKAGIQTGGTFSLFNQCEIRR